MTLIPVDQLHLDFAPVRANAPHATASASHQKCATVIAGLCPIEQSASADAVLQS
ncbi:MAG: hypothetical protein ACLR8L_00110 [Oscillospiraceae bacterium]